MIFLSQRIKTKKITIQQIINLLTMKKLFLRTVLFVFMAMTLFTANANECGIDEKVRMKGEITHPSSGGNNESVHRVPVAPLYVDLTGYVLTFPEDCVGFVISLVDEDGAIVYANVIGSTGVVVLSNDLTGSYTLQATNGSLMYSAEIEL